MRHARNLRRGLFLHYWPDLDTNPTVMGLVRLLSASGFELDLCYETRASLLPPRFDCPGVTSLRVSNWRNAKQDLPSLLEPRLAEKKYAFVIATDPQGLAAAGHVLELVDCPLVYLSFEILFKDELTDPKDLRLKEKECELSQRAALVIVQDERRGTLLARENGIPPGRFIYLPNAPSGPSRNGKSTFLLQRFAIPREKIIVLHAGSFAEWTHGEELCNQAHEWDDRFVLVVHTRHRPGNDPYLAKIAAACDPRRVKFSTEPLPFDAYGELISGCDIGLVLYKPLPGKFTQKNIMEIGLSSGKFSWFMRHGKPVVASNIPTYQQLCASEKIGVVAEDIRALGASLERLSATLPDYSRRCLSFFDSSLAFERHAPGVIKAIQALN